MAGTLIPIRWQYFITLTNLTPEFADYPAAEGRVHIVSSPTEFPVNNTQGYPLFYLEKKPGYEAPAHIWVIPLLILLGLLLVLIIIHTRAYDTVGEVGAPSGASDS